MLLIPFQSRPRDTFSLDQFRSLAPWGISALDSIDVSWLWRQLYTTSNCSCPTNFRNLIVAGHSTPTESRPMVKVFSWRPRLQSCLTVQSYLHGRPYPLYRLSFFAGSSRSLFSLFLKMSREFFSEDVTHWKATLSMFQNVRNSSQVSVVINGQGAPCSLGMGYGRTD